MSEVLSSEINRLEKAFDSIERETPVLKSVADAFKVVIINRAVLKARISEHPDTHVTPPKRDQFSKGQPWLTEEMITSLMDPWGENVKFTMLPLAIAFPSITPAVLQLREALEKGDVDLESCTGALVEGREEDIIKTASYLGFQPTVLKFILCQMLKPFVEKRTEGLRPLIKDLPWHQGYCPICGAFPELSFIQGDEGQRWLRCSLCGYDWRFDRMTCPYCGEINKSKEFTCVVGFEHEWVELCPDCHRYIVGIDLRKQAVVTSDVAAIGMVHLDIIAQQKGFSPIANCAWNMVAPDK
jgi:FdhE protein